MNATVSANSIKIVPTNELPPPPPANTHELVSGIPGHFDLRQNYPNPFNPTTVIRYSVPEVGTHGSPVRVTLKVYDILGREVATLVDGEQHAGNTRVRFDAGKLPSGTYVYRLQAGSNLAVRKMVLMK
jgi:hypothetical protein